jgi:tRNA threonylcarbamoyladenosine biosynthesis protein TsaB
MTVLLIDTCGALGSIALADPALGVIASATLPGRAASEHLVLTIGDLLAAQGITMDAIDAVVAVHGPGSFTGLRVGLSAAKGLCEASGIPLLAVSRLEVLARLAAQQGSVLALIDAGRGEFYAGQYLDGKRLGESLLTRDEAIARGTGCPVVAYEPAIAESLAVLQPRIVAGPLASDAWPIAEARIAAGDFDDVAAVDANYVRRSDAEIFAKPGPPGTRPAQAFA